MIGIKHQMVTLFPTWSYCDGLRIGVDANEKINGVIYETLCCHCRIGLRLNKLGFTNVNSIP